jgi:hypothetical protein
MEKLLSQAEVDALLGGLSEESGAPKEPHEDPAPSAQRDGQDSSLTAILRKKQIPAKIEEYASRIGLGPQYDKLNERLAARHSEAKAQTPATQPDAWNEVQARLDEVEDRHTTPPGGDATPHDENIIVDKTPARTSNTRRLFKLVAALACASIIAAAGTVILLKRAALNNFSPNKMTSGQTDGQDNIVKHRIPKPTADSTARQEQRSAAPQEQKSAIPQQDERPTEDQTARKKTYVKSALPVIYDYLTNFGGNNPKLGAEMMGVSLTNTRYEVVPVKEAPGNVIFESCLLRNSGMKTVIGKTLKDDLNMNPEATNVFLVRIKPDQEGKEPPTDPGNRKTVYRDNRKPAFTSDTGVAFYLVVTGSRKTDIYLISANNTGTKKPVNSPSNASLLYWPSKSEIEITLTPVALSFDQFVETYLQTIPLEQRPDISGLEPSKPVQKKPEDKEPAKKKAPPGVPATPTGSNWRVATIDLSNPERPRAVIAMMPHAASATA